MFNLAEYLKSKSIIIEKALKGILSECVSGTLCDSINYSLTSGGKRIRPVLVLTAWDILRIDDGKNKQKMTLENCKEIIPLACALEMIHAYSLVHDDLPAMDNDDLRRGKPTNHKVYGDAIAILAGDALLTQAFNELYKLSACYPADKVLKTIKYIADASGMNGMVGGQALDIQNDGITKVGIDEAYLYRTSSCKTGALITASVATPAILLGRDKDVKNFEGYGKAIGVAFQIVDDVLGVTASREELGKTPNIDSDNNKVTFVSLLGIEGAKNRAKEEIKKAKNFISGYGPKAEPLIAIADYIVERKF
ncbi:MAG: polyprenyl synthetase family protein [Proteobacteria bacterium]|nr:polyprenyl synthetase family protein [Pseudomonadota bacterium]